MGLQALQGVKVADFGWYATGPLACKYLADYGAEVVRIESSVYVDGLRTSPPFKDRKPGINRSAFFALFNGNKLGVTLDLRNPVGIEVAKKIVHWSDIVVDNHTPGVMDRLGLGYGQLAKVKPDVIMLCASGQGQTGPYATHPSLGTQLQALAGFVSPTGWPDRDPCAPYGAYTDEIIPVFNVITLLAALEHQRRTGKGAYIDICQMETSIQFMAHQLLDFEVNGRVATRVGNRSPGAAPHGAFRCRGEDSWCAMSVSSDKQWVRFCQAIGSPGWTNEPRFATLQSRKENEDELNRLVESWSTNLTPDRVMMILQAAGVPAGVVHSCQDLSDDPQLRYRQHWWEMEHPEIGRHSYESTACRLSRTPAQPRMPAPCIGEHNHTFYTGMLGMSDEEFIELQAKGIFDQ